MRELPYFKNYVDEYLTGDIRLCSYETQGVFAILKCLLWKKDGYLPNNPELISRISGIDMATLSTAMAELWQHQILVKQEPDLLFVKFILEQINEIENEHGKKSESGKKGAMARWNKPKNKGVTKAMAPLWPCQKVPMADVDAVPMAKHGNIDQDKDQDKDIKENIKKAVSFLFHRKETTKWTDKENAQLSVISKRPDVLMEFKEIRKLYESGYKYRRQDIITFLNNWSGELDRARNWRPEEQKGMAIGQKHIEQKELEWTRP